MNKINLKYLYKYAVKQGQIDLNIELILNILLEIYVC